MARPIRVALVAPTLSILGGHSVQAVRLLNGWRDDPEVQLRFVPINPPPPRFLAALARIKYIRTIVTQLCYWPRLVRELGRTDVVHVFSASNSSFYLAPLPAIIVSQLYGKPFIVNYRSGDAEQHLGGSSVAQRALRSADLNVVPSSFLRGVFAGFDIPAHVIANVAEMDRFRFRVRSPLRPRLLSTRNLEPLYNVACTIRAFARVQARYPHASLTIVGDGSDGPRLRALTTDLRLRNVTFTGQVPQSAIHQYYADADIYVQTPTFDNMPGSVIEAFASGLPVVSTDVGGVPAILSHGVHGLLAPPDDDADVAARVIEILEDPALARRMADAAFSTCREYEWPTVREQWRKTYRSLARD